MIYIYNYLITFLKINQFKLLFLTGLVENDSSIVNFDDYNITDVDIAVDYDQVRIEFLSNLQIDTLILDSLYEHQYVENLIVTSIKEKRTGKFWNFQLVFENNLFDIFLSKNYIDSKQKIRIIKRLAVYKKDSVETISGKLLLFTSLISSNNSESHIVKDSVLTKQITKSKNLKPYNYIEKLLEECLVFGIVESDLNIRTCIIEKNKFMDYFKNVTEEDNYYINISGVRYGNSDFECHRINSLEKK